jgi:hypothetical protein
VVEFVVEKDLLPEMLRTEDTANSSMSVGALPSENREVRLVIGNEVLNSRELLILTLELDGNGRFKSCFWILQTAHLDLEFGKCISRSIWLWR